MTVSNDPTALSIEEASKPSVSYIPVNPELAERWLTTNTANRNLRQQRVNQYANDMAAGRWTLSNDAICFDAAGNLLNGQHRLHGVIMSGATIIMLIARNMPANTMSTMDGGIARTAADVLGFRGETNTHALAATAKLAILYQNGLLYKDSALQGVSKGAIEDFVDLNPDIRHSTTVGRTLRAKIDCAPSVLGVGHWIIAGTAGVTLADYYFDQLGSRAGEPEGSAVHAVDSRLRQLRHKRIALPQRAYLALLVKGWNHYARDHKVSSVTVTASAQIPEPITWKRH